jgi:rhamnose transport system permease protein
VRAEILRAGPSLGALAALYLFLALTAPRFYQAGNLRDLLLTNAAVLLVSAGMTLVIILAQIDISVGSLFAVTSVACGFLASAGIPMWLLPLCALIIGGALGAINGALVSFVAAPSIVVTLATMVIFREGLRWITGGAWVADLPADFQWFGLQQSTGEAVIVAVAALVFAALWWCSHHISAFRSIYATGSDPEAARLAGISTRHVIFWVFVLNGALTGIAAMLNAIRFPDVPANSGINLELEAIAAVVVGGTPISGGQGSLLGTLVGALLLGSIGPALTFLGVSAFWVKAIQGAIVLATVFLAAFAARGRKWARA